MRRLFLSTVIAVLPVLTQAETSDRIIWSVVSEHILPGVTNLAQKTALFAAAAQSDCTPSSDALRTSYGDAFDAWVSVSHLRFGPTEVDNRAFALAFWPDSRGATPRTLATLIAEQDPVATNAASYADVSIAARGFYAMEFLLFDDAMIENAQPAYLCNLVQTVAADIAANSAAIAEDWETDYQTKMLNPTPTGTYRSDTEVLQELFKALTTGLEFTSDTRLGRPLGTYDAPRPARAEVWRSARSARHVALSLDSLRDLAQHLSADNEGVRTTLSGLFDKAIAQLDDLGDPAFAGVALPQSRLRIEVLQQSVDAIRTTVRDDLGPTLGVASGFNALDGD
tara:strand:- start:392 stop:1408 length:1017 start_codon:yes stop_codon:yes gene_type:complete